MGPEPRRCARTADRGGNRGTRGERPGCTTQTQLPPSSRVFHDAGRQIVRVPSPGVPVRVAPAAPRWLLTPRDRAARQRDDRHRHLHAAPTLPAVGRIATRGSAGHVAHGHRSPRRAQCGVRKRDAVRKRRLLVCGNVPSRLGPRRSQARRHRRGIGPGCRGVGAAERGRGRHTPPAARRRCTPGARRPVGGANAVAQPGWMAAGLRRQFQ
jgi:hypothetical protein